MKTMKIYLILFQTYYQYNHYKSELLEKPFYSFEDAEQFL